MANFFQNLGHSRTTVTTSPSPAATTIAVATASLQRYRQPSQRTTTPRDAHLPPIHSATPRNASSPSSSAAAPAIASRRRHQQRNRRVDASPSFASTSATPFSASATRPDALPPEIEDSLRLLGTVVTGGVSPAGVAGGVSEARRRRRVVDDPVAGTPFDHRGNHGNEEGGIDDVRMDVVVQPMPPPDIDYANFKFVSNSLSLIH